MKKPKSLSVACENHSLASLFVGLLTDSWGNGCCTESCSP